jgi:alkylhydroperoxidase family enzyme
MEALTRITEGHAPDEVYEEVRRECSDGELIALSMAIGGIACGAAWLSAFAMSIPRPQAASMALGRAISSSDKPLA